VDEVCAGAGLKVEMSGTRRRGSACYQHRRAERGAYRRGDAGKRIRQRKSLARVGGMFAVVKISAKSFGVWV